MRDVRNLTGEDFTEFPARVILEVLPDVRWFLKGDARGTRHAVPITGGGFPVQ
jgi:hypothetical protein